MPGPPFHGRVGVRTVGVLVVAAASLLLAGCGGAPAAPDAGLPEGATPGPPPRTGHLAAPVDLREVLAGPLPAGSAGASVDRQSADPAAQQAAVTGLNCAAPDAFPTTVDPARPLVACAADRTTTYVLAPTALQLGPSTRVELSPDGRVLRITPDPATRGALDDYTSAHVGSAVALVRGSRVLTAPAVDQPVHGPLEISGADADPLFRSLTSG